MGDPLVLLFILAFLVDLVLVLVGKILTAQLVMLFMLLAVGLRAFGVI
jgi:hypothetical protein